MKPEDFKGKILCGTGHRPSKLGGYSQEVFQKLITCATIALQRIQPSLVISGMALGWDQALAQAAINLNIPFAAILPCDTQASKWTKESEDYWKELKSKAAFVESISKWYTSTCMQDRNIKMIDNSDLVLALWDGSEGGTCNCLNYAKSQNKPWINMWKTWQKGEF